MRCPGLPPVLVSIVFHSFRLPDRCFYIHSSLAIELHSCFFFTSGVSAPIRSTFHLLVETFRLWVLVPDGVVQEEHMVHIKQKPRFKFLPGPRFESRTSQSNGCEL